MGNPGNEYSGPEIWSLLAGVLDSARAEHEQGFLPPSSDEETSTHNALDAIEDWVYGLVTTGQIPDGLEEALSGYQPGSPLEHKVRHLLAYNITHDRIEFEVGYDVCWRLRGLAQRVRVVAIAFIFLVQSDPSDTAIKYLRQASALYLAGYTSEVFVMCGALIEAAIASRVSDQALADEGRRPAYRHSGVYSLGQRMQYEEAKPFLTDELRKQVWQVVNWRNDSVHVQPDIGPDPGLAIITTANLLRAILPR